MPERYPDGGEFDAQVLDEDGRPVVRVQGDIDVATADRFGECVEVALSKDPRLVIDLSAAPFMDSTGLSVILRAYHASGQVKEGIVVRSPCDAVRRTLEISGVDALITLEP